MKKLFMLVVVIALFVVASPLIQAEDYKQTEDILSTDKTVIGEVIRYPSVEQVKLISKVVVIEPGSHTIWHKHGVPMFAYMVSGSIEVDYGDKGKRVYAPGVGFMEAMDQFHRGYNPGTEPAKILVLFLAGDDLNLVIPKPE